MLLIALAATPAAHAVTTVAQTRHLVYAFTWGTTNNTEVHVSGLPDGVAGNGGSGGGQMDGLPPGPMETAPVSRVSKVVSVIAERFQST